LKKKRRLTFKEKRPNKFESGSDNASSFGFFDPTNMTYSPTPKISMAVPTRNESAFKIIMEHDVVRKKEKKQKHKIGFNSKKTRGRISTYGFYK